MIMLLGDKCCHTHNLIVKLTLKNEYFWHMCVKVLDLCPLMMSSDLPLAHGSGLE